MEPFDESLIDDGVHDEEPIYVISIAARLVGMHQQSLRYYERAGLISPSRTTGGIRMYSNRDIQRIRQAQRLIDQLGVNLAGVDLQQITGAFERLRHRTHIRLRGAGGEWPHG